MMRSLLLISSSVLEEVLSLSLKHGDQFFQKDDPKKQAALLRSALLIPEGTLLGWDTDQTYYK